MANQPHDQPLTANDAQSSGDLGPGVSKTPSWGPGKTKVLTSLLRHLITHMWGKYRADHPSEETAVPQPLSVKRAMLNPAPKEKA